MTADPKIVFEADAGGDTPEHARLSFTTTDLQGGNRSHGAKAELTLAMGSTGYCTMIIEANGKKCFELPPLSGDCRVRIVVGGDFEITGLAEALVELDLKTWPLVHKRKCRMCGGRINAEALAAGQNICFDCYHDEHGE
jgi:hypothetical protein